MEFKNPQRPVGVVGRGDGAGRPVPADPPRRRPGALRGPRTAAARGRRPGTRDRARRRSSSPSTPTGSRRTPSTCARSTGTRLLRRDRARPADQIDGALADGSGGRSASSSAGRWASPSTSTPCATIREIVNLLLLRGNIGRPGAGVCPVRGHSNVQGDRTMGIWEQPAGRASWTRLDAEFGFDAAARARLRHRRRDPRHARRRGRSVHRHGRQLRARPPRTPT